MPTVTITYLEMHSASDLKPKRSHEPRFKIREATTKQWELNRLFYLFVGNRWAWNDKRNWTDEQWRSYAESDSLRTFLACYDGSPAGYYELRTGESGDIEIAILGLAPKFIGRGLGGALLTSALEDAWWLGPKRVWVHTCTLDHPDALANYQARGMKIYKVETREAPSSSDSSAAR